MAPRTTPGGAALRSTGVEQGLCLTREGLPPAGEIVVVQEDAVTPPAAALAQRTASTRKVEADGGPVLAR